LLKITPKTNPLTPKTNPLTPKTNPLTPKTNPLTPKTNPEFQDDYRPNLVENQCEKCEKILTRHNVYIKHIKTCKGKINPLECRICKEVFTLPQAKYRHQQKCTIRHELEQIQIHNNNITNNNIHDNIQNNIQNNIKIAIYSSDPTDTYLTIEPLLDKIGGIIKANKDDYGKLINEFNKQLYTIPENRCVVKTNLRSGDSQVHIGNNKWETRLDSSLFPNMICNSANTLSLILQIKKLTEKYPELHQILDYIGEEGYCNTDDIEYEKKVKNLYKNTVMSLIRIVYDITVTKK